MNALSWLCSSCGHCFLNFVVGVTILYSNHETCFKPILFFRVLYDYDDYYDLELADLTDDKLELSVNDRLKNLFSHKLNDPFFQN